MSQRVLNHRDYLPHLISAQIFRHTDVLSKAPYKQIVVDSLAHCIQRKGLCIHAWVLLSNELLMVAHAAEGFRLGNIARDLKKFTSISIVEALKNDKKEPRVEWLLHRFRWAGQHNSSNEYYQVWEHGFHPVLLSTVVAYNEEIERLHQIPVLDGIVWKPEHYKFSSAIDFAGGKGLLPLTRLSPTV